MSPRSGRLTDAEVRARRPPRHTVDPWQPQAFFVEPEVAPSGRVEDVATLFLTNAECAFHCVHCDLWRNTTSEPTPPGAIPAQIDFALKRLPPARHVKLYNSGNFFDTRAIPRQDHAAIAARVSRFDTVIVENHPNLCGPACGEFRDLLGTELEVALGLETADPQALSRLNKRLTLAGFERAVDSLLAQRIHVRAFVLLPSPFVEAAAGVAAALHAVEHAFERGVRCCSLVPLRVGNGTLEELVKIGEAHLPSLNMLEAALEQGLQIRRGRVFVDLWDVERLAGCGQCAAQRVARLRGMNLTQSVWPVVECGACGGRG